MLASVRTRTSFFGIDVSKGPVALNRGQSETEGDNPSVSLAWWPGADEQAKKLYSING